MTMTMTMTMTMSKTMTTDYIIVYKRIKKSGFLISAKHGNCSPNSTHDGPQHLILLHCICRVFSKLKITII